MARRPRSKRIIPERRRKRATNRSDLEEHLAFQLNASGIEYVREHRFAATYVGMGPGVKARLADAGLGDWRFDFAWPTEQLAVEVEGGAWVQGGHNTGVGFSKDLQKYHHAARLGWFVYRCDGVLIKSGEASAFIESWLLEKRAKRQRLEELADGFLSQVEVQDDVYDAIALAEMGHGMRRFLEQEF